MNYSLQPSFGYASRLRSQFDDASGGATVVAAVLLPVPH